MRRILPALLVLIFITACVGLTQAVPLSSEPAENTSEENAAPIPSAVLETTAPTPVSEPALTATPVPPPAHWYWVVENQTNNIIAIDPNGEKRKIGTLPASEAENFYQGFPLDPERALFFTADDQLHAYLLTLNGMQPIELPADTVWGPDATLTRSVIAGRLNDHILFTYSTQEGVMDGFYPESRHPAFH